MCTLRQEKKIQRLLLPVSRLVFGVVLGAVFLLAPFYTATADVTPPLPAVKPLIGNADAGTVALADIPLPARKPDNATVVADSGQNQRSTDDGVIPVPGAKPMPQPGSPLAQTDILLYKKIFAFQSEANWEKADELIAMLTDFRLRGHVLYQRYMHPTAYRATFEELAGWMNSYADHPGADRVYTLAQARMPSGYSGHIEKPQVVQGVTGYLTALMNEHERVYTSRVKRSAAQRSQIADLQKTIESHISKGAPTAALNALQSSNVAKLMDAGEYDTTLSLIANSYMMAGNIDTAYELARSAAGRSGDVAPRAGWVGGLTAWRRDDFASAAPLFVQVAESSYSSSSMVSAGGYWAARAYTRAGNVREAQKWLKVAASHPRTFYGLIATRALGWDFDFNWDLPEYNQSHAELLRDFKGARRAMLLTQAGQHHLAEAELHRIPATDREMVQALMAYAGHMGLPSYAMRLASAVRTPEGRLYDAGLYPLAPWVPQNGYKVDRALIHALIRQESRFNPSAANRYSGATGLMQLMPQTATYVAGDRDFRDRTGHYALKDPQINLDIGQSYVRKLMSQGAVDSELFSLVIAYNAGPGNLRRWKRQLSHMQNDPLLFIESIPMFETRTFVERVMANYWIYRMRLGQPTPSLDVVVEGGWPRYVQLDDKDSRRHAAASQRPYTLAAN